MLAFYLYITYAYCYSLLYTNIDQTLMNSLHHYLLSLRVFAKYMIKRKTCLALPKGSNQRHPCSFSNHRIHCTTLSWLQTLCVEVFSLPYITTKFITVKVPFYREESIIHNNVKTLCSLFCHALVHIFYSGVSGAMFSYNACLQIPQERFALQTALARHVIGMV